MKNLLRGEEIAEMLLAIFLFSQLEVAWWWLALLWLTPDLAMLGYGLGPRAGALIYNVVHHKATGIVLYLVGALTGGAVLQLAGVVLFGHTAMDRIFGYGLKYADDFHNTHLGKIGKARTA